MSQDKDMKPRPILRFEVTGEKDGNYHLIRDLERNTEYDLISIMIKGRDGREHVMVIEFISKKEFQIALLDNGLTFKPESNYASRFKVVDTGMGR